MRGALAANRRSARRLHLWGATALVCIMAYVPFTESSFAQSIDLAEAAGVSTNGEMLLEADTIVYDNDQATVTAVGGVQIDYDGYRLVAQRVAYNQRTARLIASGQVEIVSPDGTKLYSDEIDITDDFRDGFVNALRVQTADNTYFAAENADRREGNITTFTRGVYTACEPCEEKPDQPPIWRIKAQKIIWNGKTKTVRFEKSRFEMFGMPLAFLPAFEIADPTVKQKSGFLFPRFKSGSRLGSGVEVPYYWAVSPTADVTFKPAWYSKQGFMASAEWRQKFDNGEYSITVAGIRQRSPEEFYKSIPANLSSDNETTRAMIGSTGTFQLNSRWVVGWDVLAQTDKNFAYRYGIDGYDQHSRTNQVYLTGLNGRNYFDLRGYKFDVQEQEANFDRENGVPNPDARDARQPWVFPSFDYSYIPDQSIAGGELSIDINTQSLYRRLSDFATPAEGATYGRLAGIEGWSGRVTAEAEWKRSFVTQGGLMLTPLLHARGDAIGVDFQGDSLARIGELGVASDVRSAYYRTMATAGLEARWPVLFSTTSSTHVLEPMAQIFARPNEQHASRLGIPNEDAQSMVFDASNLFERDKFSGYDRVEGGVRANLGLRYSGNFANGWSAHGLVGQSFHLAGRNPYASADFVNVGAASGLESDRSDYVASLGVVSPVGFNASVGARLDEDTFEVRRTDLTAGYTSTPVSVSAVYSFIEKQPDYGFADDRHEIRGSASVRVHENWRVFGSGTYDVSNEVMVSKAIGFAYDDECFSYAFTAAEHVNRENTSDKRRTVGFQISLRTLGDFATSTGISQN